MQTMREQYLNEDEPALIASIDKALALSPNDPFLLNFKAEYLLRHKHFAEGWKLWENRETRTKLINSNKELPLWDGSDLNGRTLLVAGEQGVGDHIMYARWLPTLAKQNGIVVLFIQLPFILDRLMGSISSIPASSNFTDFTFPEQFPNDVPPRKLDHIDCWIPLSSLPLVLGQYEPSPEPYIKAAPEDIKKFRLQYFDNDADYGYFKVGLCWQGNPTHPFDKFRSIPFRKTEILNIDARCRFYSLQKGEHNELVNLCDHTQDMADVAAVIANLDLVITVDTSIAHLAGAMGKPVWILLSKPFDWRWGTLENPTVWYDSARYFWQTSKWQAPNPWDSVLEDVIDQFM